MDRNGLLRHVGDWIERLGSQEQVAKKCGISGAALSGWLSGKYGAKTDMLDQKIAKALEYTPSGWVTVPCIDNYRKIKLVFDAAKSGSIWYAISNKAGSGKSETLRDLFNKDRTGTVLFIQAEEWTSRQFLSRLASKTNMNITKARTASQLTDIIVSYINSVSLQKPILVIDEADKLKPSALRTLIPIYNRTEGRLGAILSGTENFEKEMKAGVRAERKGYDELDSRLGRSYIHLLGATAADVWDICTANGIDDVDVKGRIYSQLEKVRKQVRTRNAQGVERDTMVEFVEDLRRLTRLITNELLLSNMKGA